MSLRRQIVSWLTAREVGATEREWRDIRLSFSQYGEDLIIQPILGKDGGTYLDIGANHPLRFSNTYHLYKFRKWRGVLVEPNPELAKILQKRRPGDLVLPLAVGARDGVAFFEKTPEHTLSRIVSDPSEARHPVLEISVLSLRTLLTRHADRLAGVEFLNVDCEGMDFKILEGNDWERCRPKVICAESSAETEDQLNALLSRKGYHLIAKAQHSRIFALAQTAGA